MKTDRRRLALANRRISIRTELLTDRLVSRTGLTAAQAHMLFFILRHSAKGTSLTDIHREFGFSKATLCRILKQLRQTGYVRAEPCAEDERRKLLFGTEKGAQVERVLDQAVCQACDQLYEGFSEAELLELDRLQKKMMQNLSVHTHSPNDSRRHEDCEESPTTTQAV